VPAWSRCLTPDGELTYLLGRLEEVLLHLVPVEPDDEPAPAGLDAAALEAIQDIRGAVLAVERGPAAQLYAFGGTFGLVPLRFVEVEEVDLAAVGEAVAALGLTQLHAGNEWACEVLACLTGRSGPAELVAIFARAHGLVDADADADADTLTLARRLAGETGRVVLTVDEEAAYKRLTDRALAMFHHNDPLARFVYRGP
jgi:hypothetical protein